MFFPAYWNYFKFELEPISTSIYSALHRVLWTPGFLASIMFTKDIYGMIFKKQTHVSESSNNNQTDDGRVRTSKLMMSPQIGQLMNIAFKCIGKLHFALYLIHSAFIRFDWYTSREMRSFHPFSNVSSKCSINSIQFRWSTFSFIHSDQPRILFSHVLIDPRLLFPSSVRSTIWTVANCSKEQIQSSTTSR